MPKRILAPNFIPLINDPINVYCSDYNSKGGISVDCLFNLMVEAIKIDEEYQEEFRQKRKAEDDYWARNEIKEIKKEEKELDAREQNHQNITKHGFFNTCSVDDNEPLINKLLANTYGEIDKSNTRAELNKITQKHPILYETLAVNAILASLTEEPIKKLELNTYKTAHEITFNKKAWSIKHENSTSIVHVGKNITDYNPKVQDKVAGYYSDDYNIIVLTNRENQHQLKYDTLFHEMTHNLIQKVFKNKSLPYKKEAMASFLEEKTKAEESFYQAKMKMLQEMQNILWDSFGFKISIASHHQNDSYVIGTSITDLMSRRNIDQNNIYSFIEFFRKNNWDINKPVIWLEGQTPFELIISDFNAKLTDVFMKKSKAQFSSIALHIAASSNKKDLLDWFFENAPEYDINFKTCQGKMAIDLATDPEIIKMLVSAGATIYNVANHQDTCKICDFLDDTEKLEQAHGIRTLLGSYLKYFYPKEREDSEIIARFVEVLSQSDDPKLLNMVEPIEHYWDNFISPLVGYYLKDFGLEKVCLPLIDEHSLYQDMFI